jgi:hypothetical protein
MVWVVGRARVVRNRSLNIRILDGKAAVVHIVPERVLMGDGPWTVERLSRSFKSTLGVDLKPSRML